MSKRKELFVTPRTSYANDPERELLVEGEANLGEKNRYHPSAADHITNSKFGLYLPLYRLQDIAFCN